MCRGFESRSDVGSVKRPQRSTGPASACAAEHRSAGTGSQAECAVRRLQARRHSVTGSFRERPAVFPRMRGGARRGFGRLDSHFWNEENTKQKESAVEQNERLTEREADVLRLLARGRSYAQAAI